MFVKLFETILMKLNYFFLEELQIYNDKKFIKLGLNFNTKLF